MELSSPIKSTVKPKKATKNEVVVSMEHVKKSFNGHTVLSDISIQLFKGENLVVLGRSGQGKSVAIKCIIGLLQHDAGKLEVFARDVKQVSEEEFKEIRMKVGFLFQSGALYDSMTVKQNLAFPLTRVLKIKDKNEINQKIEEVLDAVGLLDAMDKLPSDLSGGMRKRVGLARTLILNPEIMLYDEPTTGLDPITSKEISELILDIQKKYQTSSIIITHDMECARITSDRIVVMNDGLFIAEGKFEELENDPNELVRSFFK